MKIKQTIEKVPGGLMIVPLILAAFLNTVDQMHLAPFQWLLEAGGAKPVGLVTTDDPPDDAWVLTIDANGAARWNEEADRPVWYRDFEVEKSTSKDERGRTKVTWTFFGEPAGKAPPAGASVYAIKVDDAGHLVDMKGAKPWESVPYYKVRLDDEGEIRYQKDQYTDKITKKPELLPYWEVLRMGGFTSAVFKTGALTLIGVFLVCVGAQMSFKVGGRSLKKGLVITGVKLGMAMAVGYAIGAYFDPFGLGDNAFLGLSMVAIIAALENGNGGLYAALTGQYGNRSDVGAISVISLNDGPFFTLLALGIVGEQFPVMSFAAVLIPMLIGFVLGNLDSEMRAFLKQGEQLTIPFFAFALGAGMNLAIFLKADVLVGGLFLGLVTVCITGPMAALALRLTGEKSQIAGVAEASTAGNAAATPAAIYAAAELGNMAQERVDLYGQIVNTATAQVSISTLTTALLCPIAVIMWDKWQRKRGIDAKLEYPEKQDLAGDGI